MRNVVAFLRRDALVAMSYRVNMLTSILSMVVLVIPLYFVAGAVQPIAGDAIADEGGQYFGFVVAGLATYQLVLAAVTALPNALGSGLRTGTFEALVSTPARLPALLLGLGAYPVLWAGVRALVMLATGALLGAEYAVLRTPLVLVIWAGIVAAYLPFGIIGAAMMLVARTTGPLPSVVLTGSMLLGGVYYPTHVIPSWLEGLAALVPLTYGLRALRRTLAPDPQVSAIAADMTILVILAGVLLAMALGLFEMALTRSRRTGTLAQY